MNLNQIVNSTLKMIKSNSPEILTALGVSGVITTAYLTGKASARVARDEDADPWMSNKEKVKRYWKLYIPATLSGAVTIGCIISASKSNSRRTAAAMTAYSLTERAFSEYKEKVVEQIGAGKEQKLRDELAQRRVTDIPHTSKEVIITSGGNVLCCEQYTHRYFRSDMESLRRAMNDTNALIVHENYVMLDEFYDIIGLPHTSVSDKLGWDSAKLMELQFSTVLSEEGEPCLAFEYNYVKPLR